MSAKVNVFSRLLGASISYNADFISINHRLGGRKTSAGLTGAPPSCCFSGSTCSGGGFVLFE